VGKGCFDPDSLAECSSRPARTPFRAVDPQMVSSSLRVFRSLMFDGSRPKVQFGHSLGLQPLNQNPVSHPSSIGTVKCNVYQAEATGIGSASCIFPDGRRRIPFPDLRTEPTPNPRWPSRRDAAEPLRYRARARKLTPDQEASIRALAGIRTLRSLAAEFGVSHETIRTALRQNRAATR
jgi:hypothetical protein